MRRFSRWGSAFLAAVMLLQPSLAAIDVPVQPAGAKAAGDLQLDPAGSSVPRFRFEVQADGEEHLVLGVNVFTSQQIVQFVVALSDFLESVSDLAAGQTLVLRQDGIYGYVALAASSDGESITFTLTLHAEAPRSVDGIEAVQFLGIELAEQLLTR